jgi:hypothetical protein
MALFSKPRNTLTIFAATLVHVFPRLTPVLIQTAGPQHVEVTQLYPSPHSAELLHAAPQLIFDSSMQALRPSVVCSQMQLAELPPLQAIAVEHPKAEGVLQVGGRGYGAGAAVAVAVAVLVVVVVLVMILVTTVVVVALVAAVNILVVVD